MSQRELRDKSQQREREMQRLLLIHPIAQTTELQTARQTRETGKKKRERGQSEEDLVQQIHHSNTDLFTD